MQSFGDISCRDVCFLLNKMEKDGTRFVVLCEKKSPHFWSEGEAHLLSNMIKDLDINRYLDMCTFSNANIFTKMDIQMKECGCCHMFEQICYQEKTLKNPILMQRS